MSSRKMTIRKLLVDLCVSRETKEEDKEKAKESYTSTQYRNDYRKLENAMRGLYHLVNCNTTIQEELDKKTLFALNPYTHSVMWAMMNMDSQKDSSFVSKLIQHKFDKITAEEKKIFNDEIISNLLPHLSDFLTEETEKLVQESFNENSAADLDEDNVRKYCHLEVCFDNYLTLYSKTSDLLNYEKKIEDICDNFASELKLYIKKRFDFNFGTNVFAPKAFFQIPVYNTIHDKLGVKLTGENAGVDFLNDDELKRLTRSLQHHLENAFTNWKTEINDALTRKIDRDDFFNQDEKIEDE